MIDREQIMFKQRLLLLVSCYLCFSKTAADIFKDLGNFPICAVSIILAWEDGFTECRISKLAGLKPSLSALLNASSQTLSVSAILLLTAVQNADVPCSYRHLCM